MSLLGELAAAIETLKASFRSEGKDLHGKALANIGEKMLADGMREELAKPENDALGKRLAEVMECTVMTMMNEQRRGSREEETAEKFRRRYGNLSYEEAKVLLNLRVGAV